MGAHVTLGQVAHNPSLFFKFSLGILTNPRMFFGYLLLWWRWRCAGASCPACTPSLRLPMSGSLSFLFSFCRVST